MAILYGIIIAALMGLSAFTAAWLMLRVKATPQWRPFKIIDTTEDDKRVEKEIQQGGFTAFNLENPPNTASEMGQRFAKKTASQELKDATRMS
jgi:hypothetical protein